ncbi:MAG: TIGR00153 family protein [Nitrospirae bacterium]|nr:TIGR00153 family protein [Nitrospirota bacterium]
MKTIGGVLGRSPFGPLHEHMMKVNDCLKMLKPLMESFLEQDYRKVADKAGRISKLEHEADMIKGIIKKSLSRSLFVSVERADILACLKEQDRIADSCEDVAKLLEMRKTEVPPVLQESLLKLTDKVMKAVEAVREVSKELKNLAESSYNRSKLDKLLKTLELAARREWEADEIQLDFAKKLFGIETKLTPVSVFFLINISREVGAIADHAENVADCLNRIISGR